jgi:hypothetical protein
MTQWRTAYVNGQTYPAETVTATISGPTSLTYTYPQMLLTLLHPGAVITQVRFDLLQHCANISGRLTHGYQTLPDLQP